MDLTLLISILLLLLAPLVVIRILKFDLRLRRHYGLPLDLDDPHHPIKSRWVIKNMVRIEVAVMEMGGDGVEVQPTLNEGDLGRLYTVSFHDLKYAHTTSCHLFDKGGKIHWKDKPAALITPGFEVVNAEIDQSIKRLNAEIKRIEDELARERGTVQSPTLEDVPGSSLSSDDAYDELRNALQEMKLKDVKEAQDWKNES